MTDEELFKIAFKEGITVAEALRNVYSKGFQDAAQKIKDSVHEVISCGFYCLGEYCETEGEGCEKCIQATVEKTIDRVGANHVQDNERVPDLP